MALAQRPDLCILDVSMPRLTGLQAAREIRAQLPDARVLMLSMHDDERYLFEALKAGASGYVLKREADHDLVGAVHAVSAGEAFLTNAAERSIIREWMADASKGPAVPLTPREEEVVKLIAEAHTNAQIAEILHLSEKTIESHRANVLRKLGMRDRVQLVRYAIRRGLIEAVGESPRGAAGDARRETPGDGRRACRRARNSRSEGPSAGVYHRARASPRRPHRRPAVPGQAEWVNVAMLRMDQQLGRPVLIEFWDFCRPNSLRTLPYMKAWHERYEAAGLRVIGVHAAGLSTPSRDPDAVRRGGGAAGDRLPGGHRRRARDLAALRQPRLARALPVQPARASFRLPLRRGRLRRDRARRSRSCSAIEREPLAPLRPEDAPGARSAPQSEDVAGPYSGPYEAGGGVGGARRRRAAIDASTGERSRSTTRAPTSSSRTRAARPAARARARGDGVALPRRLLHPRAWRS